MQAIAQRILLLSGWRRAFAALAAGALTALAQAPFHLFAVAFLTFPVLVWLLDGAVGTTPGRRLGALRAAFATGWLFGLGYFVAGLWWIANALLVEAPQFAWALPLAVLGVPAVLALFYGAACALARLFWSDGFGRIAGLAAAFGLAEWARAHLLTGFPWNAIGYALMPTPVLMQTAAVGGLFAMNLLAVLVFALPAQLAGRRGPAVAAAVVCLALVAGHAGYGLFRLADAPVPAQAAADRPVVRLVQPAIAQHEKMDEAARTDHFALLLELTALPPASRPPQDDAPSGSAAAAPGAAPARPDLIIWPETSVPYVLTRQASALAAIGEALPDGKMLLTGAIREEPGEAAGTVTGRYYNSVVAVTGEGVIAGAADKVHLVPFGEYLPFADQLERIGLRAIAAADRGYSAAPRRAVIDLPGGLSVLPLVCYEVIFPWHAVPPAKVDAIVNVTNDAWFGRTPGPWQHLHQARLRSVETGLPMVRAANNGISVLVDPFGRIIARLGHDVRAVADAPLPAAVAPPFSPRRQRLHFWIVVAALLVVALAAHARRGARRG